jgi:hypothetical protein
MRTTLSHNKLRRLVLAAVVTAAVLSAPGAAPAVAASTTPRLIGVIDSAKTAWVKDGISGAWVQQMAGVKKIAISGSRIAVIDLAGTMWAKDGTAGTWVREQVDVKAVTLAGNSIGIVDDAGTAWVKTRLRGGWIKQRPAVRTIALSGNRIAIVDSAGTMWAKDGIAGPWVREQVKVNRVALAGIRIGIVDSAGTAWVKDHLHGAWVEEHTAARTIALSANRIAVVDSAGTMLAKDGTNGRWVPERGGVKLVALSGNRMGVVDSTGTAWAKDGSGSWVQERATVKTIALPTWATTALGGGSCNGFTAASPLGTSYADDTLTVATCGPIPGHNGGPTVLPYPTAPFGTHGYQCVEFSQRFLYHKYGAREVGANGNQLARRYAAAYPTEFHVIHNGTGSLPRQGDVISESDDRNFSSDLGHTAVVQSVGDGQITIEQENYSRDGAGTLTYSGTHVTPHGFKYIEWLSPR